MLRKYLVAILFVVSAATVSQVQAQQQYPWSANNSQGVPIVTGNRIQPPIMNASSILQEEDAKKTVQDKAGDYSFRSQTENAQNALANPKSDTEPGLNVQSNAVQEGSGFTNCDDCQLSVGCPKRLFGNRRGFEFGGFAQAGYHSDNTILFNDRRDEFALHQFWMHAGRRTSAQNNVGFRLDTVYGIDGPNLQAIGNPPDGAPSGWDNGWDFGSYGWAMPQAYVEFGNGISTLRAGKFLSPFGLERLPSVENFFYSRTYTRVQTEPFSHTGLIAEHRQGNNTFILGATAGWDTAFDGNSGFNVLTGFCTQLNENVSFKAVSSLGDTGPRGSGILNSYILNLKLLPAVDYAIQVDSLNLSTNRNDEFGVVQYLTYRHSDFFGLGSRLEWWKTDRLFANTKSTWAMTFGANVRPHSNFLIRPEVRFDWGAAAIDPGRAIFGIDAIVLF